MRTQKEQILNAKRAYIMQVFESRSAGYDRYSVYLDAGEGLSILWPSDCDQGKNSKDRLPAQVYWSRNRNYPAFHFALGGGNYSKTNEIRTILRKINPEIEVYTIAGYMPSNA